MLIRRPALKAVATASAALLALAACGDDDGETSGEQDSGSDAGESDDGEDEGSGEVTIRFTWWGNPERDEATNAMVDLFMEEHPNINVETEPTVFDGYFDKLATSTAAGDAQDVITLGGSYPTEYGAAGQLLDLTTVSDIVRLDEYNPNTYTAASIDDAVYGLPTGGNALGLFVNLDLVEQAGVELPDDTAWTWDDFVEFAGELSANLPDDTYGTDWRIQEAKGPFAQQRDKPLYLPEGGLGVDVETITELYEIPLALLDNGGMPSAEETTQLVNTQMEQTLFGQGKAATMFGYSNQLQAFGELLGAEVDILRFPGETTNAAPGVSVLPSQFFAVYSGSEHPEEAAMLVDWLLNEPEPAKIILDDRGLQFNTRVLDAIKPELPEGSQRTADYLSYVTEEGGPTLPPPTSGQGEVDDMTLRLQEQVLFGQLSPEEAAQQWVDEANSVVE